MISKTCVLTLLFCFVHLVCSFPLALVDTNTCKKGRGDFPKPGSLCRSFYRCNNWIPVEMPCPGDQHFFPAGGYCVWPEEFPCLEKPKSMECPLLNGNFLKQGTKCKEYYDCCNGKPTVKRCFGDTIFDHIKGKCDWPELVTCPDDISTTESTSKSTLMSTILPTSSAPSTSTEEKVITITSNPTSTKIFTTESNSQSTPTTIISTSSIPSTSTKEDVVTITSNPTATKNLTPVSGEDSSEEGNSSEESGESTTKSNIKSTPPTISTISDDVTSRKDIFTTPSTVSVDQKETSSSSNKESTKLPANITSSNYESSSALETSPETVSTVSTAEEDLTVSGISTSSTDETDAKTYTYPNIVTDETSPGITESIGYRDKHSTTMTSGLTDSDTFISCPKSDGIFPHPSDRHKFIACVGGNPTVMDCPEKLVYVHKSKSCQYERKQNSTN